MAVSKILTTNVGDDLERQPDSLLVGVQINTTTVKVYIL